MKLPCKKLLFSMLLFSHIVVASDLSFDITSAKSVLIDNKILYVSAKYPNNLGYFQTQLNVLWDKAEKNIRIDEYHQPWREVEITELEKIYGVIDKIYIAVFRKEANLHKATKAFLFRWGCDNSIISVIELGEYKFSSTPSEWGVDAFGVTSLKQKIEVKPIDNKIIPKDFFNPIGAPYGYELWVNELKRFTYIDRNQGDDVNPMNLLIDHTSKTKRTIVKKSPFSGRC